MSVKDLKEIRDEVVTQIKDAFAETKIVVEAVPGQFNESEIRRLSQRTPAILTSLMRYSDEDHNIDFATWILYRADSKDRLYDGALKIVSAIIPVIRNIDLEYAIDGGTQVNAECLYSGTLDNINITLWGIRWKLEIREPISSDGEGGVLLPDDLEIFEGYDATHHINDAVVEDIVNLEDNHGDTV